MATAEKQRSTFGEQLRPILEEKGLSVRKLGRLIDPENHDRGRRNLVRWVSTGGKNHHKPTRESRDRVADALGVDRSAFDDDDDEEEDPAAAMFILALNRRIDAAVERSVERLLAARSGAEA